MAAPTSQPEEHQYVLELWDTDSVYRTAAKQAALTGKSGGPTSQVCERGAADDVTQASNSRRHPLFIHRDSERFDRSLHKSNVPIKIFAIKLYHIK